MKNNKIKIAKFLANKVNNLEKITGGDMVDPNLVSSVLGASVMQGFQAPEIVTNDSCPINCSCSATQSNGCIQGSGVKTGTGN